MMDTETEKSERPIDDRIDANDILLRHVSKEYVDSFGKNVWHDIIDAMQEYSERFSKGQGEARPLDALVTLRNHVETALEDLEGEYISKNKGRMGALASQDLRGAIRLLKRGLKKTDAG